MTVNNTSFQKSIQNTLDTINENGKQKKLFNDHFCLCLILVPINIADKALHVAFFRLKMQSLLLIYWNNLFEAA